MLLARVKPSVMAFDAIVAVFSCLACTCTILCLFLKEEGKTLAHTGLTFCLILSVSAVACIVERQHRNKPFSNLFEDALFEAECPLVKRASYCVSKKVVMSIVQGSVNSFASASGAIVFDCDGSLETGCPNDVNKLQVGEARIIGPKSFGKLDVPFVIHVFCPNFNKGEDKKMAKQLLYNSYWNALDQANEQRITQVAFSLLSSGYLRGEVPAYTIIMVGVQAIRDWCERLGDTKLKDIAIFAQTDKEALMLLEASNLLLAGMIKVKRY